MFSPGKHFGFQRNGAPGNIMQDKLGAFGHIALGDGHSPGHLSDI